MLVNPALSTTIASGKILYRITSLIFSKGAPASYRNVVNGLGVRKAALEPDITTRVQQPFI